MAADRPVVLIVDDEAMLRLSFAMHLEENGFEVLEASDAASAIAILQKCGCPVALVFTDVCMPGEKDGLELARWISQNCPHTPTIIASGDIRNAAAMNDLCGADALTKPYSYDVALDKIRAAIKKRADF